MALALATPFMLNAATRAAPAVLGGVGGLVGGAFGKKGGRAGKAVGKALGSFAGVGRKLFGFQAGGTTGRVRRPVTGYARGGRISTRPLR